MNRNEKCVETLSDKNESCKTYGTNRVAEAPIWLHKLLLCSVTVGRCSGTGVTHGCVRAGAENSGFEVFILSFSFYKWKRREILNSARWLSPSTGGGSRGLKVFGVLLSPSTGGETN